MKIILTKDVAGIGRSGEVKEVSEGHARNFLLPRRLALPATVETLAKAQKEQAEKQAKVAKEHERALNLKHKLQGKVVTLKAKANGKNLFAAIHPKEIAEKLAEMGVEISAEDISFPKPIKSLGAHEANIRLAHDVIALVKLNVEGAN